VILVAEYFQISGCILPLFVSNKRVTLGGGRDTGSEGAAGQRCPPAAGRCGKAVLPPAPGPAAALLGARREFARRNSARGRTNLVTAVWLL